MERISSGLVGSAAVATLAVIALAGCANGRRVPGEPPPDQPLTHSHPCDAARDAGCGPAIDPAWLDPLGAPNLCYRMISGSCDAFAPDVTIVADAAGMDALLATCTLRWADGTAVTTAGVDFPGDHHVVLAGFWVDPVWCGGVSSLGWLADDGGTLRGVVGIGPADCDALIGDFWHVRGAVVDGPPPASRSLTICGF